RNPDYKEMDWPAEYWPKENEKATKKMWDESVAKFEIDYANLLKIVKNSSNDLFAKIPHGQGQTTFREVLQIIDHNSYHIGQFIIMRRLVNQWK
ncbi:MAG TPA: DinB family protein, partial [Ignavibacteria bacterium]